MKRLKYVVFTIFLIFVLAFPVYASEVTVENKEPQEAVDNQNLSTSENGFDSSKQVDRDKPNKAEEPIAVSAKDEVSSTGEDDKLSEETCSLEEPSDEKETESTFKEEEPRDFHEEKDGEKKEDPKHSDGVVPEDSEIQGESEPAAPVEAGEAEEGSLIDINNSEGETSTSENMNRGEASSNISGNPSKEKIPGDELSETPKETDDPGEESKKILPLIDDSEELISYLEENLEEYRDFTSLRYTDLKTDKPIEDVKVTLSAVFDIFDRGEDPEIDHKINAIKETLKDPLNAKWRLREVIGRMNPKFEEGTTDGIRKIYSAIFDLKKFDDSPVIFKTDENGNLITDDKDNFYLNQLLLNQALRLEYTDRYEFEEAMTGAPIDFYDSEIDLPMDEDTINYGFFIKEREIPDGYESMNKGHQFLDGSDYYLNFAPSPGLSKSYVLSTILYEMSENFFEKNKDVIDEEEIIRELTEMGIDVENDELGVLKSLFSEKALKRIYDYIEPMGFYNSAFYAGNPTHLAKEEDKLTARTFEYYIDEFGKSETSPSLFLTKTDEPDTPDKPDEPDEPDTPDKPDEPDEPDTPDKPDEPDEPDTPDKPDEPDEPDTPDKPDEPDTPDKPDEPEEPEIPDKPEKPEESEDTRTSDVSKSIPEPTSMKAGHTLIGISDSKKKEESEEVVSLPETDVPMEKPDTHSSDVKSETGTAESKTGKDINAVASKGASGTDTSYVKKPIPKTGSGNLGEFWKGFDVLSFTLTTTVLATLWSLWWDKREKQKGLQHFLFLLFMVSVIAFPGQGYAKEASDIVEPREAVAATEMEISGGKNSKSFSEAVATEASEREETPMGRGRDEQGQVPATEDNSESEADGSRKSEDEESKEILKPETEKIQELPDSEYGMGEGEKDIPEEDNTVKQDLSLPGEEAISQPDDEDAEITSKTSEEPEDGDVAEEPVKSDEGPASKESINSGELEKFTSGDEGNSRKESALNVETLEPSDGKSYGKVEILPTRPTDYRLRDFRANYQYNNGMIIKQDALTGRPLEGAEFEAYIELQISPRVMDYPEEPEMADMELYAKIIRSAIEEGRIFRNWENTRIEKDPEGPENYNVKATFRYSDTFVTDVSGNLVGKNTDAVFEQVLFDLDRELHQDSEFATMTQLTEIKVPEGEYGFYGYEPAFSNEDGTPDRKRTFLGVFLKETVAPEGYKRNEGSKYYNKYDYTVDVGSMNDQGWDVYKSKMDDLGKDTDYQTYLWDRYLYNTWNKVRGEKVVGNDLFFNKGLVENLDLIRLLDPDVYNDKGLKMEVKDEDGNIISVDPKKFALTAEEKEKVLERIGKMPYREQGDQVIVPFFDLKTDLGRADTYGSLNNEGDSPKIYKLDEKGNPLTDAEFKAEIYFKVGFNEESIPYSNRSLKRALGDTFEWVENDDDLYFKYTLEHIRPEADGLLLDPEFVISQIRDTLDGYVTFPIIEDFQINLTETGIPQGYEAVYKTYTFIKRGEKTSGDMEYESLDDINKKPFILVKPHINEFSGLFIDDFDSFDLEGQEALEEYLDGFVHMPTVFNIINYPEEKIYKYDEEKKPVAGAEIEINVYYTIGKMKWERGPQGELPLSTDSFDYNTIERIEWLFPEFKPVEGEYEGIEHKATVLKVVTGKDGEITTITGLIRKISELAENVFIRNNEYKDRVKVGQEISFMKPAVRIEIVETTPPEGYQVLPETRPVTIDMNWTGDSHYYLSSYPNDLEKEWLVKIISDYSSGYYDSPFIYQDGLTPSDGIALFNDFLFKNRETSVGYGELYKVLKYGETIGSHNLLIPGRERWGYLGFPDSGTTLFQDLSYAVTGERDEKGNYYIMNRRVGDLIISKVVEGEENSDKEFEFTVVLKDENNVESEELFDYILSMADKVLKEGRIKSGEVFRLADGQRMRIKEIPYGTGYLITEEKNGDYETVAEGNIGTVEGKETFVTFTNTKIPDKPDEPDNPPDEPDKPNNPPETPDKPNNPPEIPDKPNNPPETPVVPPAPKVPETPAPPTPPETPVIPEKPLIPETPKKPEPPEQIVTVKTKKGIPRTGICPTEGISAILLGLGVVLLRKKNTME